MTALQELERYLVSLERRLRVSTTARGIALIAGLALLLTVVLTWFANLHRFSTGVVLPLRILLFAALAFTVVGGLALPLFRIRRRYVTRLAETRISSFGERLLTVTERADPANPFIELLAADTLRIAQENGPEPLVSSAFIYGFLAVGSLAAGALVWMIFAGPGYWGYGSSLLWTGTAHASSRPIYDIKVQPGSTIVRRRSDQVISAQLVGFSSNTVMLHAKYRDSLKWDELPMRSRSNDNGYELLFPGLSDSLEYYVQAGDTRTRNFVVQVKDLPAMKRVRVKVHYPAGIGLKDAVDDPGGDIRAVEGSQAEISVLTDKPLDHGLLVLENGSSVPLTPSAGNWSTGTLPIRKDGEYHVATLDSGQKVRITEDYFIEAKKDEAPSVRIVQPGRDPHVSPIEEVPITVEVADDFGVHDVDLHYSVNGGAEQVQSLLKGKNLKEAQGKTLLSFEDFKLAPGDLVSMYATAADGSHRSRSDIVFAQAEPFDFKFKQSQQAGGGGGQAGDQGSNISQRQKEIIAATWNQLKDGAKDRSTFAQNAQFLSGLEGKLGEQAKALSERMGNRELVGANPEFAEFSKSMLKASSEMAGAVNSLQPGKWNDALPAEQQALQSLLHAESIFRDIQVAFGQSGGGGGGSSGEQRELARLFDLELDTSKNQYETGQSAAQSADTTQKEVDAALQRLKDLAKRQEELAEQPRSQAQDFQQRWEQEQLRREAEQLRQQMQQLAQNAQAQSGQQQGSGQSSRQQSSSSGSSSSNSGSQSASSQPNQGSGRSAHETENLRHAMDALKRAGDEMGNAASKRDSTAQQRAAGQLAAAQSSLTDMLHQKADNGLSELVDQARQLAAAQKDIGNRVKQTYGAGGINTAQSTESGEGGHDPQMPEMNGPGFGGYRRRSMFMPSHAPTKQEKALATEGERLAEDAQKLQDRMQQQAQALSTDQPDATRKLRRALSETEQQELAVRMKKNSDWLREGYGERVWPMEDSLTAATERLTKQLQEARAALDNGKPGSSLSQDSKVAQALAEVRSLRDQMNAHWQQSQASGGQQSGQSGEAGESSGSAQSGPAQRGGGRPGLNSGEGSQEAVRDLSALRSQIGRNDARLDQYLNDAIGSLRRVNAQPGLFDSRLSKDSATQEAVASLGRLELELQHRLEQQNSAARTGSPESAPAPYRQAVAEYFRTLSK